MVDYTIVNTTASELTNVNVGGIDVAPRTIKQNVTLTDAELAAAVALSGVVVVKDDLTRTQLRVLARGLRYLKTIP